jgi:quercetin dioxygenase-like cupin family protein
MSIEAINDQSRRTIQDATSGETITFLETADESGGDRVVMEVTLAPGAFVPLHAHPAKEVFDGLEGQLRFQLEGQSVEFGPGSTLTALPGKVHGFRNASRTPVTLHVVATPGAQVEYGLRVKIAMFQDGAFSSAGRPKDLLLAAVVLHDSELYMPPLPVWLYRTLIATLAALGRWRGREQLLLARYPDYARLRDAGRRRARGR